MKTDVGGVKTDLGKTQTDLAGAMTQLQSMKGDMSDHSSLIARNHDELEILKHKGDRNYYEFTLVKGQKKPVGTVSLELKKADMKKSRFTLVVFADDRSYEKKDRNVDEPLQFYSGKEPALYEIVINAHRLEKPGLRLSFYAQGRARSAYRSVTAPCALSVRPGWYRKPKVKSMLLRPSHCCLRHAEGGDESPLRRLTCIQRHIRRKCRALPLRQLRIGNKNAFILRRHRRIARVDSVIQRHIGQYLVQKQRSLALVVKPHLRENQHLIKASCDIAAPLASNPGVTVCIGCAQTSSTSPVATAGFSPANT